MANVEHGTANLKFSYIAMFSANVTMKHFFLEDFHAYSTYIHTYVGFSLCGGGRIITKCSA